MGYSKKKLLPQLGAVEASYFMATHCGSAHWAIASCQAVTPCHTAPSTWGSTPPHHSPSHCYSPPHRTHSLVPLLAHKVALLLPITRFSRVSSTTQLTIIELSRVLSITQPTIIELSRVLSIT